MNFKLPTILLLTTLLAGCGTTQPGSSAIPGGQLRANLPSRNNAAFTNNMTPRGNAMPGALGWQPEHTWVFVVGLVKFKHKDVFDSFPVENRRDVRLVQFFQAHKVPANHIVYLQDSQATSGAIEPALVSLLHQTAPGDTLFLYYEGHGYRSEDKQHPDAFFAAYDTDDENTPGWSVNTIAATIDKYFRGDRALLTADCCYSGYMAQTVKNHRSRIGYACVASSSAREESTGHWTFSDCLLDALNGAPYVDLNGDGAITVAELAAHAHAEMAIAEEQHSTFATNGGFSADTVLALSAPHPPAPIGQRVEAKQDGTWYAGRIVGVKQGKLQVSYIGYDEPAEWFDANDRTQVKPVQPPRTFPIGASVEVKWHGQWYAAKVLKVEDGVHFIHYVEDDSSWDEWVSSRRIREPRK